MFWGLDIKNGAVSYDDISFLTEENNLLEQVAYLKEDMLQIEFPGNMLIDIGWRPSFEENGAFYVTMVSNCDWENPIAQAQVFDVASARKTLSEFIENHLP